MHVKLVDGTIWAIMHLDDSKAPSCNKMDLWGVESRLLAACPELLRT